MNLTLQEIAHVLAALRFSQGKDLQHMPQFEDVKPLTDKEVDQLCEQLNLDPTRKSIFTVVGLHPDSDWGNGLYDASFVDHVQADSPIEAARAARLHAAQNRLVPDHENDEVATSKQVAELARNILVLAVFFDCHRDEYDPRLEMDEDERKER